MIPTREEVLAARKRVSPYIHNTPVLSSTLLNELSGTEVYFKCDNFQKGGAYKLRGAMNAALQLSAEQKTKGIITHSSGNFAQAIALTAKSMGIKAYIVMPDNAPKIKKSAVLDYGAEVIECESTQEAREAMAAKVMKETGATFLHPSNDLQVIIGQGTAAQELFDKHKNLDYVLTPVGGGGVIAGTALAAHYLSPQTKIIGGEPFGADDAYHSLQNGRIMPSINPQTIADGLRTCLGDQNFPIIQQLVDKIIRVEEDEIINAMRLVWERMKIIIEPSSAVPFAAVLRESQTFKGKKIGIIVSGGNVDLSNLPF